MLITSNQVKAARGLIDWTQDQLATSAGLEVNQVRRFESGKSQTVEILSAIQQALAREGIEFIDGGVRRHLVQIKEYNGADGFRLFMDDVYETVKAEGGIVCAHNVNPDYWMKWLGKDYFLLHTSRMQKIEKDYKVRITIKQDDNNLLGSKHAEYRWLPAHLWNDQSFYSYGDKIGLLNFQPDDIDIRVICDRKFSEGFRSLFTLAWENIPPIPNAGKKK